MSWEEAGGAAPLPGHGRLSSPCGGGGCREAAAPYADVGDLKCLPEITAHVGRGGERRGGGVDVRFSGWGTQREPLSPAPPPPSWGRQPRSSPNPARKSARREKNTRRKMSRGRKKKNLKKKNNNHQTRRGLREGRSRLVRAGGEGGPAGGGGRRRGGARRCPRAEERRCRGQAVHPLPPPAALETSPQRSQNKRRMARASLQGLGRAREGPILLSTGSGLGGRWAAKAGS